MDAAGHVITTEGFVRPEEIGFTLPHEHTFVQLWHVAGRYDYVGQVESEDILARELEEFTSRGGSCLVDLTLPGMGRNLTAVSALARRTGLHIVVGTGYYREPYFPAEASIDRRSVQSLADEMLADIEHGIGDTGIHAGIIGEVGSDKPWVSAQEERVARAAGRAQSATGLALTTHSSRSRVGRDLLDLFVAEGADPARVIIGHCDTYPDLGYYLELIDAGASVEFDLWGNPEPYERGAEPMLLDLVLELLERRHERSILLSQDVAWAAQLKAFGGKGYSYVQEAILPQLRERGVPQDVIDCVTVENPRRLLTVPG
jgi:predicted metal-dependent phosphotriesterase family hydrolase